MKAREIQQIVREMRTSAHLKTTNLPIRQEKVQELLQSGQHFHIEFAPKGQKEKPVPISEKFINNLKIAYHEINSQSKNQQEFLSNLWKNFQKNRPENTSYQEFATKVVNEITEKLFYSNK